VSQRAKKEGNFFVAGGTLGVDADCYVSRPADTELLDNIKAGHYCYILTARQMGKSSLMARTAHQLENEPNYHSFSIDMNEFGPSTVKDDQFYFGLLDEINTQLRIYTDLETWWETKKRLGSVHKFKLFLKDTVLEKIEGKIVIFLDEIDVIQKLPFRDDFFAVIRSIYNDGQANHPTFGRFIFVFLGVATPNDLIKDPKKTPFDIAERITLRDFEWAKAKKVLNEGLEEACSERAEMVLKRIFYWTNGHPYLTQKLCKAVVEEAKAGGTHWTNNRVDNLVHEKILDEWRDEDNLIFVHKFVSNEQTLISLYRKIFEGQKIYSNASEEQNRLKISGLVREEKELLIWRNEIYRFVFDLDWIKQNLDEAKEAPGTIQTKESDPITNGNHSEGVLEPPTGQTTAKPSWLEKFGLSPVILLVVLAVLCILLGRMILLPFFIDRGLSPIPAQLPPVVLITTSTLTSTPPQTATSTPAATSSSTQADALTLPTAPSIPTYTPSPIPTDTLAPTPTNTAPPTKTPTPTDTPLPTYTPTSTTTPTVTPTPTPDLSTGTFTLLNPLGLDPPTFGETDFEWEWAGPPILPEYGFEVRVWREGEPEAGIHDAVVDNKEGRIERIGENGYRLRVDITDTPGVNRHTGEYRWTVKLVRIHPEYEELGIQATPNRLQFNLDSGSGSSDNSDDSGPLPPPPR
jgi:hypothetical protein